MTGFAYGSRRFGQHIRMLTLFLRAIFLDLFVLLILRLTGKRQVSDLQPYDLLMTLIIADLASTAIADTDIPLLYSVVPILALYLVQQLLSKLCLKSSAMRRLICGTPQILILDGVLQEKVMRRTNYTVRDLLDSLRAKDVFSVDEVAYAILETNGTVSVLEKSMYQNATRGDLKLEGGSAALSHLLILEGKLQKSGLNTLHLTEDDVSSMLKKAGLSLRHVFFAEMNGDGALHIQLDRSSGSRIYDVTKEES
jgi:Predicted membrane protein